MPCFVPCSSDVSLLSERIRSRFLVYSVVKRDNFNDVLTERVLTKWFRFVIKGKTMYAHALNLLCAVFPFSSMIMFFRRFAVKRAYPF